MTELPDYLRNRTSRKINQDLVGGLGGMRQAHVSIAGNRFTLVDASGEQIPVETFDPKAGQYLQCVIMDANPGYSRVFYAGDYSPGQASYKPPDCWSDNQRGPSIHATNPQADNCVICKNAVWGSKVNALGRAVPACGTYKKIAVAVEGYPMAFLLRIPPGSLKSFSAYTTRFLSQKLDASDVITRVSFDTTAVGILIFQAIDYISEDLANLRDTLQPQCDALVGRNDMPRDPALPLPAQSLASPAPAAQNVTPLVTTSPRQPTPLAAAAPQAPVEQAPVGEKKRGPGRPPKNPGPQAGATAPFKQGDHPTFGVGNGAPVPPDLKDNLSNFFETQ